MTGYHQVHLDFHTSEHVPDIGCDFDPDMFAETIKAAGVDCIVLFAKCHHGWAYYDTSVGERHPNLGFDLLRKQYDACKERGIAVQIYYSIGWDERQAHANPGWRRILPDGQFHMMLGKNLDPWWSYLCLNTPYKEFIAKQSEELARLFPDADGFWFDIIRENDCCCSYCRDGMSAEGLDWTNPSDQAAYAHSVLREYLETSSAAARIVNPKMPVFQNTSMAPRGDLEFYNSLETVEIEAVPTGGWGYDHFPISARYLDAHGYSIMGVTTRFHIVWGELGGMKHPNALQAEAATMLAHGSAVCIGDHLATNGVLDPDAWREIGSTFNTTKPFVSEICDTHSVAEIGLLSSVSVRAPGSMARADRDCAEDEGAHRALSQTHFQYDVIDAHSDFAKYKTLILPDRVRLDETLACKLQAYVKGGGGLLLTGESGLKSDASGFALDVGARFDGKSPFDPTYIDPVETLKPDYVQSRFSAFSPSLRVTATNGKSLGDVYEPFFQRGPRAFSGHINTPPKPDASGYHAGVQHGRIVYLSHFLFTLYRTYGHVSIRDYITNALALAHNDTPVVKTDAPSGATVTLREKSDRSGLFLQIVYTPRELRGQSLLGPIEVIEDLPVLHNVKFSVAISHPVLSIRARKADQVLSFTEENGVVAFDVARITCNEIVEIQYNDET